MNKAILIGIGGGTASGKTLLAKNIESDFKKNEVNIIKQDSYYQDLSEIPMDVREEHNFDHPKAFDFDLMIENLQDLADGKTVKIPIYDYQTHTRSNKVRTLTGHKIIILEGIHALTYEKLRELMDVKVFIEAPDDIRFIRRLKRDINERGRTVESVIEQYLKTVRPMHEQFVEPTKQYADIIIPEGGQNKVAIDLLTTKVQSLLDAFDN